MAVRLRDLLGNCNWYLLPPDRWTPEQYPRYAYCNKWVKEGRRIVQKEIKRYHYTDEDLHLVGIQHNESETANG